MTDFKSPPHLAPYAREIALPDSMDLFAYDAGDPDAPALLLIHGLGEDADTWRHVIEPLAQKHRVIAPDLPGFGRSAKPNRAYTVNFHTGALLGLMDAFSIERTALCGHSLGAVLAHALAVRMPHRVSELFLVGGALTQRGDGLSIMLLLALMPFVGEFFYSRMQRNPDAAYDGVRAYYADLNAMPRADRDFLYRRASERVQGNERRRAYFSTLRRVVWWFLRESGRYQAQLPALQTPTRVIWGDEDALQSVAGGRAAVALQPNADLTIIPNAGHNVQEEGPGAFLDAIGQEVTSS
jgi:pimeloyl-ACP methyl ester carboxylesterase